ncbi:MAG: ATP-binding protein [Burkholderiales bacterium]|nr:ATP-binding protein [Burkholderiales bacterium]
MTVAVAPLKVPTKWRPPLSLIVAAMLCFAVSLPLGGVFFFRIYENQLVRQTEAELIAQSAMLAAAIRADLQSRPPSDIALGPPAPPVPATDEPYRPIAPDLDLTEPLLPRRPEAEAAARPASPAARALGERMAPLLGDAQRVTLAGFRLLEPTGVVIAGREELGLSLAHVEEVAAALRGVYRSVLRQRISKHEAPPLTSLSRGNAVRVFVAYPVVAQDHVAAVIYASRTPANVFKHLYEERRKVALASLAVIALTVLAGLLFHRAITRPVRALIGRTRAIAAGDRKALRPLDQHGTAEFAELSQSFLTMASSLAHRSDYIASFAAHVSHELKSPLTSMRGAAELLRDDEDAGAAAMDPIQRRRFLDHIVEDASRLGLLLERLRELAKAEAAPTTGAATLAEVLPSLRGEFAGLAIGASGDLNARAAVAPDTLRLMLQHLLDNAARHGAERVSITAQSSGGRVVLSVCDDGPGVADANCDQIFEPFFTTRRQDGGTGMGLAIVRAMAHSHGGEIRLVPAAHGAAFGLALPLAERLT